MKFDNLLRYPALFLLLFILLFVTLGDLPIYLWDESRLAMNAWEMFSNRQFFVLHFNGEPDLWNTKPPLMIWLQVICIELFGFSEFSVRFPSAFSALVTCMVIVLIFHKYLGHFWLGVFAIFILLTVNSYNGYHVARTADFDALLILFITLSSYSVFMYTESGKAKFITSFFLFTGLAFIAKGAAALLVLPGLLLYLFHRKKQLSFVQSKYFWLGSASVVFAILLIYGLREHLNPGYLKAMYQNEIGGRYFEVNEGNSGGLFYYFRIILKEFWVYLLPLTYFTYQLDHNNKLYRITHFSLITALSFFVILSLAKTKLWWYASPIYPFLAVALSIGFYSFYEYVQKRHFNKSNRSKKYIAIGLVLICLFPMIKTGAGVFFPKAYLGNTSAFDMSYFLRDSRSEGRDLNGCILLRDSYQPHIDFYVISLKLHGVTINYGHPDALRAGDKVLYWEEFFDDQLSERYEYEMERTGLVREVRILSSKAAEANP